MFEFALSFRRGCFGVLVLVGILSLGCVLFVVVFWGSVGAAGAWFGFVFAVLGRLFLAVAGGCVVWWVWVGLFGVVCSVVWRLGLAFV